MVSSLIPWRLGHHLGDPIIDWHIALICSVEPIPLIIVPCIISIPITAKLAIAPMNASIATAILTAGDRINMIFTFVNMGVIINTERSSLLNAR